MFCLSVFVVSPPQNCQADKVGGPGLPLLHYSIPGVEDKAGTNKSTAIVE